MMNKIDLRTASLPTFGGQDTGAVQVPVFTDEANSFGNTLKRVINEVSDASARSGEMKGRFLDGDSSVELHQVMAASEEAGIAMDLLIELRNKTVEAYRSVINMQS